MLKRTRFLQCFILGWWGISNIAMADTAVQADKEKFIHEITQRTVALENEVKELRHQLTQLKAKPSNAVTTKKAKLTKQAVKTSLALQQPVSQDAPTSPAQEQLKASQLSSIRHFSRHALPPAPNITNTSIPAGNNTSLPATLYFGGIPVTVSPFIGGRNIFDTSNLIVNIPSVNEDWRLLQQWQMFEAEYEKLHESVPARPFVNLSGKVESQLMLARPYVGKKSSNVDISGAELDVSARATSWVGVFMAFVFDNSQTTPQRVANSRIFMSKAFATAGDLDEFPFYLTVGQAYVPFGVYASSMLSAPLTQVIARTKARYIQVGYAMADGFGPYGAIYTFKGDIINNGTPSNTSNDRINQGGLNLGYKFKSHGLTTDVGGGIIADIADSDGMQSNGQASGFTGFGATYATEVLSHAVPAGNLRLNLSYENYSLTAELIAALRPFASTDLMFNGYGAKPKALNIEGSYSFQIGENPSAISVGYQQTNQAMALFVPERRFITAFNTSLLKSTIETIEYHHDINYGGYTIASGNSTAVVTNGALGHSSDMITAQFGVYF